MTILQILINHILQQHPHLHNWTTTWNTQKTQTILNNQHYHTRIIITQHNTTILTTITKTNPDNPTQRTEQTHKTDLNNPTAIEQLDKIFQNLT